LVAIQSKAVAARTAEETALNAYRVAPGATPRYKPSDAVPVPAAIPATWVPWADLDEV